MQQPKEIKRELTEREKLYISYLDMLIKEHITLYDKVPGYKEYHLHYADSYKRSKALMLFMHNLPEKSEKIYPGVLESYLDTLT